MDRLMIIGTGPNAVYAYEMIRQYRLYDVIGFAVNRDYMDQEHPTFQGLPVYAIEDLDQVINKKEVKLFVALLWNRLNADRRKLFEMLRNQGYEFANLIAPTAVIRGNIQGTNVWVCDYVIVQNDAVIEDDVVLMDMALVSSCCHIGPHCFLGAKSTVGGGSRVGEQTFIGINCTIFDDTRVGRKCILGACTAVKRNVPDFTLYKTSSEIQMRTLTEETIEEKLLFRKNVR